MKKIFAIVESLKDSSLLPEGVSEAIQNEVKEHMNIKIKKYYQDETRFINVYSRDNLATKTKNGAYLITLDEYSNIGTHWIAL